MFSVTLSVNIRPAAAGPMLPAYFTRHAAVWCSDFPPASRKRLTSDHLPSARKLPQKQKAESHETINQESRKWFCAAGALECGGLTPL
jgi:hypothetical protein